MENNNKEVIENKDDKEVVVENNEVEDDLDDEAFLKSLENLEEEIEEEEKENEDSEKEQRQKNKDAEEARKRREAEEKSKKSKETKESKDEEVETESTKTLTKDEEVAKSKEDIQAQVKDLKTKYPDIDLKILGEDKAFQTFLKSSRWGKDSKPMLELYESYLEMSSNLTSSNKEQVQKKHLKSTPSIKGSGSSVTPDGDIFSKEDLEKISSRMATMSPKEYNAIEKKFNRSISFHNNK